MILLFIEAVKTYLQGESKGNKFFIYFHYRFYAHNTQIAMAYKGHIYVRKKKAHQQKKTKLNKQQQQQKHKQSSVLF